MFQNGAAEFLSRVIAIGFTVFFLKLIWGEDVPDMLMGLVFLSEWNFYDIKSELRKIKAGERD